jgi:hypothetical protein
MLWPLVHERFQRPASRRDSGQADMALARRRRQAAESARREADGNRHHPMRGISEQSLCLKRRCPAPASQFVRAGCPSGANTRSQRNASCPATEFRRVNRRIQTESDVSRFADARYWRVFCLDRVGGDRPNSGSYLRSPRSIRKIRDRTEPEPQNGSHPALGTGSDSPRCPHG